jgi:hypothetical protein
MSLAMIKNSGDITKISNEALETLEFLFLVLIFFFNFYYVIEIKVRPYFMYIMKVFICLFATSKERLENVLFWFEREKN